VCGHDSTIHSAANHDGCVATTGGARSHLNRETGAAGSLQGQEQEQEQERLHVQEEGLLPVT
jgi:hypothetical protein